ncbi:heterokaryon incompatibility protein-domain-containing protein [Bisporella sp. PMI_857]|nr:heterokaryon incompatibility protein-domain-containing protein [Bisporella sp. PMI_857]
MRLINVETLKLEEFFGDKARPYAILSHTWGDDKEEVSFRDIERGVINKAGNGYIKFERCCTQAKKDGLKYAWIDTCCIDKSNAVELGEAINSMFQWYKEAFICYVYLSDVPPGDKSQDPGSKFFTSRWFRRGWTLQELLAPKQQHFFDQKWSSLGTKLELSSVIQKITGIHRLFLLGSAALHEASVAQRMSWAANRVTKRKEDIAYCLLGIFGVVMPTIYGEGDRAFSRLQQEIMKDTRDDSILAWGLNLGESIPSRSADVISGGVLATTPSDFAKCRHIVSRRQYTRLDNTFEISGGCLRVHLHLHKTSAGEVYGLLNCGPEHNAKQVAGIPLNNAGSGRQSDEYIRPQGYHSVLLPKTPSSISTTTVYIQMERARVAMNRQYWFYIEESDETDLELMDVYPQARWQQDRAMIATANDSDVLEYEVQRSQKLIYMRQEAFGRQSANNGRLNIYATVSKEPVVGQPMFVVRLAPTPSSPEATVDATLELRQLDLKLEFVSILQGEDNIRLETERLDQKINELEKGAQEMCQLAIKRNEIKQRQEKLSERGSEIQRRLDELLKNVSDTKMAPEYWVEAIIKKLLNAGKIDVDLKDMGDFDSDLIHLPKAAEV